MKRGYVRPSGRVGRAKQIAEMGRHLIEVIYVEGEDETAEDAIRSLREGDELCVTTLDRLAAKRSEIMPRIEGVHSRGAAVVELLTGRRSDDPKALPHMIVEAFEMLLRDHRHQQRKAGKKHGALGGRPTDKRMPEAEARVIWRSAELPDPNDAIAKMWGWSIRDAYRKLGPRGLRAGWIKGRPRKK
jgi:DNA invertase Pin-like site-specific DNA recombinase